MSANVLRQSGALPPTLEWVGPGLSAFAGSAGASGAGLSILAAAMADASRAFGPGGDPLFLSALADYFASGGGPCVVLNLLPLEGVPEEQRIGAWIGEDGGPGYRTGLISLFDQEEVGTIALPGLRDRAVRSKVVSLAQSREGRFFILDPLLDGVQEDLSAAARAALAPKSAGLAAGPPPSGAFLAELERSDFQEARPEGALRSLAGGGHGCLDPTGAQIESWRLREGLRRSIDQGTRWVVFEPNRDLLWRRIEREVGAFLGRLHRLGILEEGPTGEAFRVRCRPPEGERPAEGHLVIAVEARIKGAQARRRNHGSPH